MKRLVKTFEGFSGGITGFMQQANLAQSGNPGVIGEGESAESDEEVDKLKYLLDIGLLTYGQYNKCLRDIGKAAIPTVENTAIFDITGGFNAGTLFATHGRSVEIPFDDDYHEFLSQIECEYGINLESEDLLIDSGGNTINMDEASVKQLYNEILNDYR
jgi:hypothetical protein